MWFKQAQIYQLAAPISYDAEAMIGLLEPLLFSSCLPSFPASHGWVPPLDEADAPLVHEIHGFLVICLQSEEKILPAVVVQQELAQKIKEIEAQRDRKVFQKEKYALKEEIILTLLPRAFTKISKTYAYFDSKNQRLMLDTTNAAKTDKFLELLSKSLKDLNLQPLKTEKITPILTRWLTLKDYPQEFSIEKSCLLRDPNKTNRTIRCQHQDLSTEGIRLIIKENYEVNELALCWQDRVNFVLGENFLLRSLRFSDDVTAQTQDMEPETKQQHFEVDFLIMSETINSMLHDLLAQFGKNSEAEQTISADMELVA